MEGSPAIGIGNLPRKVTLRTGGLAEAGDLRAIGVSSRRKRMLWPLRSVLCVRERASVLVSPCFQEE